MTLSLSELLLLDTNDQLKNRLAHLAPEFPVAGKRKQELMDALSKRLTAIGLRQYVDRLDGDERAIVAEACHDPEGRLDERRLQARLGYRPPCLDRSLSWSQGIHRHAALFWQPERRIYRSAIPAPICAKLRELLPAPEPIRMEPQPLADSVLQSYQPAEREHAAPAELIHLIAHLKAGKISISAGSGNPTAATIGSVSAVLGEYFPDDEYGSGQIKARGWLNLLLGCPWVDCSRSKPQLTAAALAVLQQPPPQILKALWDSWKTNGKLDEYDRLPAISVRNRKQTLTPPVSRRQQVIAALASCPTEQWLSFSQFSRMVRTNGFAFEMTHRLDQCYFGDPRYGEIHYMSDAGLWQAMQESYLQCLLFEYLATLGMVDLCFEPAAESGQCYEHPLCEQDVAHINRYAGLHYFRITALGAWCLGLSNHYQQPLTETPLTVRQGGLLQFRQPPSAEEQLFINGYAEQEGTELWRLNQPLMLQQVENGQSLQPLLAFITSRDPQLLPQDCEALINHCQRHGQALSLAGEALLLNCLSEQIAVTIANHPATRKFVKLQQGSLLAIPAGTLNAFRQTLHSLGFGIGAATAIAPKAAKVDR